MRDYDVSGLRKRTVVVLREPPKGRTDHEDCEDLSALGWYCPAPVGFASAQAQVFRNNYVVYFAEDAGMDPCTGELFTSHGSMRFMDIVVVPDNGMYHFDTHMISEAMTGVADSGTTYEYVGAGTQIVNYVSGWNYTTVSVFHIISHGSGQDFTGIYNTHVTVNRRAR